MIPNLLFFFWGGAVPMPSEGGQGLGSRVLPTLHASFQDVPPQKKLQILASCQPQPTPTGAVWRLPSHLPSPTTSGAGAPGDLDFGVKVSPMPKVKRTACSATARDTTSFTSSGSIDAARSSRTQIHGSVCGCVWLFLGFLFLSGCLFGVV